MVGQAAGPSPFQLEPGIVWHLRLAQIAGMNQHVHGFYGGHQVVILPLVELHGQGEGCTPDSFGPDPGFENEVGGDYRLGAASPCVDAGDNDAIARDATDADGDGHGRSTDTTTSTIDV